jgi:hypothetical protein
MIKAVRHHFRWLIVWLFFLIPSSGLALVQSVQLFPTEQAAQQHCPSDIVVWVNKRCASPRYGAAAKAMANRNKSALVRI